MWAHRRLPILCTTACFRSAAEFWRMRLQPYDGTLMKRILLVLLACVPLAAEETVVDLNPSRTTVTFTLGDILHTVRGSFKLKRGSVHFDPDTGKAGGEIVVDVTSGNTNGDARDRRMQDRKSVV